MSESDTKIATGCHEKVFFKCHSFVQRWAVRSITLPLREWKSGNLPLFHSREWKSDRPSTLPLFNSSAIGRCLGRCFLYTKEWKSDHSSTLSLFHSREWKSDRHNLKSARRVQDWRWQKSGTLLSISISNCPSLVTQQFRVQIPGRENIFWKKENGITAIGLS